MVDERICSFQALFDLFLFASNVKPSENKWHLEMVVHGIKGEDGQYIFASSALGTFCMLHLKISVSSHFIKEHSDTCIIKTPLSW